MSNYSRFSMVAYNYATYVWKDRAIRANPANRAAGVAWLDGVPMGSQHKLLDAGLTTVGIAQATRGGRKQMIFLGHRIPINSAETFTELTAANYQQIPLNTIYVPYGSNSGITWWQNLAEANAGLFQVSD